MFMSRISRLEFEQYRGSEIRRRSGEGDSHARSIESMMASKMAASARIIERIATIRRILGNPLVTVNYSTVSYLQRLVPELESEPVVVVYRKEVLISEDAEEASVGCDNSERKSRSDSDITGSPLEYSFGNDSFDETLVEGQSYWSIAEQNQLPLDVWEARASLNLCLEHLDDTWTTPIFFLCDAKDREKTVLLGARLAKGWMETTVVRASRSRGVDVQDDVALFTKEHLYSSDVRNRQAEISSSCIYELFGTWRGATDSKKFSPSNYKGSLSLEVDWSTSSFHPPPRASTYILVAEIVVGREESPLNELWSQIALLSQYLAILEEYRRQNRSSRYTVMPLNFPEGFSSPCAESGDSIAERLNRLLNKEDALDEKESREELSYAKEVTCEDTTVQQHIEDVHRRPNADFTDRLWRLLAGCETYSQVTDVIHTTFEQVRTTDYTPRFNPTNSTRIAKIIGELAQPKATLPLLAGSLPLELLIDAGVEKIDRDYGYVLLSANLTELRDAQRKSDVVSTEAFEIENYRKKLTSLARIHVCLEFLLLAQTHLGCATASLQSVVNRALRQYTTEESPIESFPCLSENRIHRLATPLSAVFVEDVTKGSPAIRRLILSSESRLNKLTSTVLYSRYPIFPPNIHHRLDGANVESESYHSFSVISRGYKIR